MSTGTIIQVDPRDLSVEVNVRTDARVDEHLVASIKEHGILQPPMIQRTDEEGTYQVILGQRRTLAAVQAGLTSIPAYLVDAPEAEAARIIDQLTENDQRQPLTDAERLGGYKQLTLVGIKPRDIAQKLHRPKVETDRYIKVLSSTVASEALASKPITLEDAEALAEFDNDPEAQDKLTKAIDQGKFTVILQQARQKRAAAAAVAKSTAELTAAGVRIITDALAWDKGIQNLASCPGHVARIGNDSWNAGDISYYCEDPDGNGHVRKQWAGRERTPEEIEAEEAARVEREKTLQAWKEAGDLRTAFIKDKLTSPKPPADHHIIFARSIILGTGLDDRDLKAAATLLGIESPEPDDILDSLKRSSRLAAVFPAALALAAGENSMDYLRELGYRYQEGVDEATRYLQTLTDWGYTLSDVEVAALKSNDNSDEQLDEAPEDEEVDE